MTRLDVMARIFVHDDSTEPSAEISLSAWIGTEPPYEKTARVWFRGPSRKTQHEVPTLGLEYRDIRGEFRRITQLSPSWTALDLYETAAAIESDVRIRTSGGKKS
jgi:hypothetical protein